MSDLHLGKRVNDFPMTDDQKYILGEILTAVKEEKPDAVLIAGDVYDKPVPPAEAVTLFSDFITELSSLGIEVFIISGNHDSSERLAFASGIMDKSGVHIAGSYSADSFKYVLNDDYGPVNLYLLPFIKPLHVRAAFPDDDEAQEITGYNEALRYVIDRMEVNEDERNILMAHQFVTGAERCESEDIRVGGLDNIDADILEAFDYVALGHLHGPQSVHSDHIRYSGSPLKYSFSECKHKKSIACIELGPKEGDSESLQIRLIELKPKRDIKEIRGRCADLTNKYYYKDVDTDDYIRVILTDEEDVMGALGKLRSIYPNIMRLEYDNTRTRAASFEITADETESRTPIEIFAALYEKLNGKPMDEEQTKTLKELIEEIWSKEE